MNASKLTKIALLTAMAIVLHIAEGMLPVAIPLPGIRLGFANIITITAIAVLGLGDALTVVALRTVLASLLSGTFLSINFLMSFSGGMTAALIMGLLYMTVKKNPRSGFSMTGLSIAGALSHNLTQLLIASLLIDNLVIFGLLPLMLVSSIPTGILIGILAKLLIPHLQPLGRERPDLS